MFSSFWGAEVLRYSGYECFLIIYWCVHCGSSQYESLCFSDLGKIWAITSKFILSTLFPVLFMTSLLQMLRFADCLLFLFLYYFFTMGDCLNFFFNLYIDYYFHNHIFNLIKPCVILENCLIVFLAVCSYF